MKHAAFMQRGSATPMPAGTEPERAKEALIQAAGAPKTAGIWIVSLLLGLIALTHVGCTSKRIQRRYYTLTQPVIAEQPQPKYKETVWVPEVEMIPIYSRQQIVSRITKEELRYHQYEQWADRPQRMISQMLIQSLRQSGLFSQVYERLSTKAPDYTFETTVLALEQESGEGVWYAHVAMSFRLVAFASSTVVWQYTFDERGELSTPDVSLTVRTISELIGDRMTIVNEQLDALLGGRPIPEAPKSAEHRAEEGPAVTRETSAGHETEGVAGNAEKRPSRSPVAALLGLDLPQDDRARNPIYSGDDVDWRKTSQFTSDETRIPMGSGAVFLPALSGNGLREPAVSVLRGGEPVASGQMGRRIPLRPGHYRLEFGSGTFGQRLSREVDVREGEVTIVEPTWSALDVSVVNEKFIPFRGTYEILDAQTRESIGVGYGADEELGEETAVWVLRPGLYKIVQPGSNYRARINFATVYLLPGTLTNFNLVMDETTGDFKGSGVAEYDDEEDTGEKSWKIRSTIGGDLLLSQSSGLRGTAAGTGLNLSFFADNQFRFSVGPHLWTTRLEIEEIHRLESPTAEDGTTPSLAERDFQTQVDRLYLNSIYIYSLFRQAGPYARLGAETSLFNRYDSLNFSPLDNVIILDDEGNRISRQTPERMLLASSFSPLSFTEGIGVNFRVVHNAFVDLDLRAGIGARQYLPGDEVNLVEKIEDPETGDVVLRYQQASSSSVAGPEAAVIGMFRITRYLQTTTELDMLAPFGAAAELQYRWRTLVSLRLSSYASLLYTLDLDQNPAVREENPLAVDQGISLRFSYALF